MEFKAVKVEYSKEKHFELCKKINPTYGLDFLIKLLKRNEWSLYEVILGDILIGIFICKIEQQINDDIEFVVLHACHVLKTDIPFTAILEPLITVIATESKCKTIRIHSDSEKVNKLILKHTTCKLSETIFRKNI